MANGVGLNHARRAAVGVVPSTRATSAAGSAVGAVPPAPPTLPHPPVVLAPPVPRVLVDVVARCNVLVVLDELVGPDLLPAVLEVLTGTQTPPSGT